MIPEHDDAWYCLILEHNRFRENPLALIFQNEEQPEIARLFDGTILEEVAEEGPWCVFFNTESPLFYDQIIQQQWETDIYWKAGSSLAIGYPGQSQADLLQWVQSRALAQSHLGNAMLFRCYSPAVLDQIQVQLSDQEKQHFLNTVAAIVWANGSLNQVADFIPKNTGSAYQLSEQFYKGLME